MELSQVRLVVQEFALMFRFYSDVLGLKPQVDDERGPYSKLSFETGNAAIALQSRAHLEETLGALGGGKAGGVVIAIRVEDVDAIASKLRARGAAPLREPQIMWGRMRALHLRDPEGNLLEFQQWLVPATSSPAS